MTHLYTTQLLKDDCLKVLLERTVSRSFEKQKHPKVETFFYEGRKRMIEYVG